MTAQDTIPEDIMQVAGAVLVDMDADFGNSPNQAGRDACELIARAILAERQREAALMPQDVVNLVIAAREFWEVAMDETDESAALDAALEAFSSRIPYENEPKGGEA